MKTTIQSLCLLVLSLVLFNCDNDDGNADNQDDCNFAGFTFLDTANNTQTLIGESELITDFYYTSSNGPEVEIYKSSDPGDFWFVTKAVTANASGPGTLSVGGTIYAVNVTCQRTGNAVGEEMRFDITASGLEAEYCVIIDLYH
ncbi:hypothetical protein KO494_04370 [Lacinutrix sp. C3R15]|uniref:hypothetical protein n=1 Tax=Flavobacteriaceae TaxID=49546 RepID=UPI001C0862B0|nr:MULTISPECIES: hypothetical protein [Flavobacteriaceae]MBU2938772.1 hypothetical protein [Lacinutrix sp. C3R15]MDO6622085.1 hypothetical protein [Oceanihabitans sp. 1_MG-2023]